MRSTTAVLSAFLAVAHGQNIISAKGNLGTSKGLQVDPNDPFDMNIIKTSEISANVVNQCGRTVVGNMDVGANTEVALTKGEVTKVTKGSKVQVQISQDNAQMSGGPYTCDLDDQSNAKGATGQIKLQQTNGNGGGNGGNGGGNGGNGGGNKFGGGGGGNPFGGQGGGGGNPFGGQGGGGGNPFGGQGNKFGGGGGGGRFRMRQLEVRHETHSRIGARANTMTLTVTMPKDLECKGASAGNVCTVRCINKQEVGGCFAVQQTDVKALPGSNAPGNIETAQTKDGIETQVLQNKQDFAAAAGAIAEAQGSNNDDQQDQNQGAAVAKAVLAQQQKTGIVKSNAGNQANNGNNNGGNNNNNNNGGGNNGGNGGGNNFGGNGGGNGGNKFGGGGGAGGFGGFGGFGGGRGRN
ncbi:uncharacterized protein PG986_006251 [Apiospora aurea]|uniref:GEgh 16 protein n=1 Tax=Apiospora aurea TaxID=335848 RepID=A0ABR1QKA8_9PEZI